jgi:hypothetical protein
MNSNLTHERLLQLIFYDEKTGNVFRKITVANVKIGQIKPKPSKNGYLRMHIDGRLYYLHRLAWFYVNKNWPLAIDHIDGNRQNNKLENLRSVSQAENMQNISKKSYAISGLKGSYYHEKTKKWQAKIGINGKSKSLGYYDTAEKAHEAYLNGKKKYHTINPELRA